MTAEENWQTKSFAALLNCVPQHPMHLVLSGQNSTLQHCTSTGAWEQPALRQRPQLVISNLCWTFRASVATCSWVWVTPPFYTSMEKNPQADSFGSQAEHTLPVVMEEGREEKHDCPQRKLEILKPRDHKVTTVTKSLIST